MVTGVSLATSAPEPVCSCEQMRSPWKKLKRKILIIWPFLEIETIFSWNITKTLIIIKQVYGVFLSSWKLNLWPCKRIWLLKGNLWLQSRYNSCFMCVINVKYMSDQLSTVSSSFCSIFIFIPNFKHFTLYLDSHICEWTLFTFFLIWENIFKWYKK